ncbi:ComF family protein [Microbulbifer sp. CAU 1566]|uniref:ComF family protein n=1 Tax=Microbulbifer sp. CAU 1566 TaxID=2933269 RepID=UPI00200643BE|nr:ComF family protein [Microbulbifer sp. CAU 1566]MCK7596631.1 ComF family protein [Microbulbifer sp. CAU 1566]
MSIRRILSQIVDRSIDRHLARCLLCGSAEEVRFGTCSPCHQDLPALGHACQRCALPLAEATDRQCGGCLQQPPPQACSHACWYYAYPVAQLIQRFKYQRDFTAGRTLAELAAFQLAPQIKDEQRPDLLVPVPMHWRKQLFERGYNQAQLIADILGKHWHIPLDNRALRKITATDSQQKLRRTQRRKNLTHSFVAHPRVRGLHIGLVDDVITTGATQEAAAQSLLDAGATRVSSYALARTP